MKDSLPANLGEEALSYLQQLVRFDTSNPPGNEAPAARYLEGLLRAAGLEPVVVEPEPGRASVVARLGQGDAKKALLLFSHLDVVPAVAERWSHPPFAAEIADGYLYGRGTLDMKNMTAMSLAVLLALQRSGRKLRRDVVFAAVADEETGGRLGAGYLVDNHPELLQAEYALCEMGGFRQRIKDRDYFLVQVAEKGCAWCRASFSGEPGHGSVPDADSAIMRLARALERLGRRGLPLQVTEPARRFLELVAAEQTLPVRLALRALMSPLGARLVARRLDREQERFFHALLHSTAVPTMLHAGDKENVIPARAQVTIDGRVLPGQDWETFSRQLLDVLGDDVQLELLQWMKPLSYSPDTPLFDTIRRVLKEREPEAEVVPYLLTAFTDAKHLDRLGVITYGFTPQNNDPGEQFTRLIHGNDERIGVQALAWGTEVLYQVVERFCRAESPSRVVAGLMDDILEPERAQEPAGGGQ